MPDFTTYQPPGVYIEEDLTSLVNVTGSRPTMVAIVGPSVGYRTFTETVTLSATTPVELSRLGIDISSVVVTAPDGTTYTVTTDYVLTAAAGDDGDIGTLSDNTTTIVREGAGAIADGGVVYVSYQYTPADYYQPTRATDFDDVEDAFGQALNVETGAITSPLSFAAKLAFENGAPELVLVSTTGTIAGPTTRSELTTGYAKLSAIPDATIVVPLAVGVIGDDGAPGDTTGVGTDLQSHVTTQVNQGIYRIGVLGFDKGATFTPTTMVDSFRSSRLMMPWPNRINYFNSYNNSTYEISGFYLAAAFGGRLTSLAPQMPLTKKQIAGFSGFPASVAQSMTLTQKNTWSDAGLAVAEMTRSGGRIVVRHGTSTDRSNIQTREISLTRAKDALVRLLQESVDSSDLIGTYIDDDTPQRIKSVVGGVLEAAMISDVIADYTGLKIRQTPGDPSIMEVKFQYMPSYPLNFIVVTFSINTSTGETTVLEDAE